MTDNPHLTPLRKPEDVDAALRPKTLSEFIGQQAARENLRVFIEAAKQRRDARGYGISESNAQCTSPPKVREIAKKFIAMSGEKVAVIL